MINTKVRKNDWRHKNWKGVVGAGRRGHVQRFDYTSINYLFKKEIEVNRLLGCDKQQKGPIFSDNIPYELRCS